MVTVDSLWIRKLRWTSVYTDKWKTDILRDVNVEKKLSGSKHCVRSKVTRLKLQRSFWATVCKTVRAMLSDRCLSVCLSWLVTFVYCGHTVGWIRMPLGTEVGFGPGYIVLDGDPAPPKRGTSPNFRPMSVVAKRLDGSRCHSVVCFSPGDIVLDRDPAPAEGDTAAPRFTVHVYCGKRLDGSRCQGVKW